MRLDGSESRGERQRTREARALDLEARLRGDAAGKLEARFDIAVAAVLERDDVHQRASWMLPLTVTLTCETPASTAAGAARAAAPSYDCAYCSGRGPPPAPMLSSRTPYPFALSALRTTSARASNALTASAMRASSAARRVCGASRIAMLRTFRFCCSRPISLAAAATSPLSRRSSWDTCQPSMRPSFPRWGNVW